MVRCRSTATLADELRVLDEFSDFVDVIGVCPNLAYVLLMFGMRHTHVSVPYN